MLSRCVALTLIFVTNRAISGTGKNRMPSKFSISTYLGSDSPRIMLWGSKDVDVKSLRELFLRLSQESVDIQLESQPIVESHSEVSIRMCSIAANDVRDRNTLGLHRSQGQKSQFQWLCHRERWAELAELLTGLDAVNAGHHYLTECPPDDALIVISKGEYDQIPM